MSLTPAPRYPLDYPVILLKPSEHAGTKPLRIHAQSLNLSQTGLGLEIPWTAPLLPGEVVGLHLVIGELSHRRGSIPIAGRVVWRKDDRCGIEILRIREDTSSLYTGVLSGYEIVSDAETRD